MRKALLAQKAILFVHRTGDKAFEKPEGETREIGDKAYDGDDWHGVFSLGKGKRRHCLYVLATLQELPLMIRPMEGDPPGR